jgi:hypothetical protein
LEVDQACVVATTSKSLDYRQDSKPLLLESSKSEDSSGNSQDELLVGCKGDLLIPTAEEINKTYLKAQSYWRTFVENACSFLSGCVPTSSLDPSIIIQDILLLPQDLSGQLSITGQSI